MTKDETLKMALGVTHCQCEACKNGNIHDSDCAIHNGNALPVGPCDCSLAAPPLLVQKPVAMRMPKVGDKVICLEDESLGEVVSLTAGGSPDILFADGSHGTYLLREFAELFGYAEQRQWVGLTGLEQKALMAMTSRDAVFETEAKLKEKNHG